MRLAVSVLGLGLVASCGSSSPQSADPTDATIVQSSTTSASTAAVTVDATTVAETTSTLFNPATTTPPTNQRAKLPEPDAACARLSEAAALISPSAQGQSSPGAGDDGSCTMNWTEADSSSMTASLLVSTKATMLAELQQVGYICDPSPVDIVGWPSASNCSAANPDGLHSLIRLDNGTEAISLAFWGPSNRGVAGQALADALLLVLGPAGEVIVGAPPTTATPISAAPGGSSSDGPLPSAVWGGKYIAEPRTGSLRIGDMGQRVAALQRALGLNGLLDPPYDGYFGPDTEGAVVKYQEKQGLPANGIASEALLAALAA